MSSPVRSSVGQVRTWVRNRLRGAREDGFILLESVIAITVITIVMGAVGAEFVGGMIVSNQQRVQQGAVQVASSALEQIRALDPSDLVTGRDSSSVDRQFASTLAALPAVQPWLTTMDKVSDPKAAVESGKAAAVPTCGTEVVAGTCQKTPGTTVYTVNQYLGSCVVAAGGPGDCVKASSVTSANPTKYLRAVVAVTWTGPRCGTACAFVTTTLVSTASDPTFRINAAPYPAPVVSDQSAQTVVVGDTVSVPMGVDDGKGVPPFTWAVYAGALPGGLVLDPSTGLISGTVTGSAGNYASTIQVTDAFARTDVEVVSWKVIAPLTATVPAAQTSVVSTPLSPALQLDASGGTGTYTWTDSSPRTLPAGLTLSPAGRISGTPTTVGSSTVTLTVASGGVTRSVTLAWNVVRLAGASYDFEEGTGTTAADGTGNNNTATVRPGAGWTTGKVNSKALNLTGASDSWAAAVNPVIDSSRSFTVASWVRFSSLSGPQTIAAIDGNEVSPFFLQKDDSGRFRFGFFRSDSTSSSFGTLQGVSPTADAWYHVAAVFDQAAGTATLYVDGVSQGTLTGVSMFRATGATTIGRAKYVGPADFVKGALDDTRFYDRTLTSAEIATLASAGAAGPTGGSVDALGLTGTGSRYSTSTTLSLALSKGTDSNGLATTSAQLYRATAPLTSSTCGTYGAYAQVGSNDPVSPFADTVGAGACYSYRYRVVDTLGNASTYVSPDIKVDVSPPTAPTLGFSAFSNTSSTDSTVYYRPGASSGAFTVTANSTDPVAGISSYAFPGFGTGWTSTVGAQGVTTYSWATANPAVPGGQVVTASNNAGLASTGTALTVVPDSTAPSAGTLAYPDRTGASTSVSLSFTTGTDTGSGIGTKLLQRASTPLTGTTCGTTYTDFATVAGGTNPASPFSDTVTTGSCYKYQYVVSDQVGNSTTATSTNVVKVRSTYADTVAATPGLLNWFRLGDSALSSDTFTDTPDKALTSHTGEVGATWTAYLGSNLAKVSPANRLYRSGTGFTAYYTSATPASADYSVQADVVFRSNIANDYAGVIGRASTSVATFYGARWQPTSGGGSWVIYKYNNGALSTLATTAAASRTIGQTDRIELEMVGSAIKLYVDGVLTTSATDATITAAGRGGIFDGNPSAPIAKTDTTGIQYDNFSITPIPETRVTDSKGTSVGTYFNGVVLGVVGAITGDANTAVTFDGIDDYATVPRTIQDDFAIEFWFKSTGGIGTGGQWWEGAGLVDAEVAGPTNDFGVSLRSDGKVVAGVGTPDSSIVSSSGGYNNGAWHHVVFNRTRNTGALQLFVDGVSAGTATGSTASLTGPATINFGRIAAGGNHFAGSLDEVALYRSILPQATITSHYSAGQ